MSRTHVVTLRRTIEVDIEIDVEVTPGEPDHYDRSIGGPGGWSPGCGPEAEVLAVRGPLEFLSLIDEDEARDAAIEDAAESAIDAENAQAEDDADSRAEARREMRAERD